MNAPTSLQNRVSPDGSIVANSARGTIMGNRGGRIHDPDTRALHPTRRWSSRQWICCEIEFRDRQRKVMGHSYTELFFLDDVTAFAAGHRPCFECRNGDARNYAAAWQTAHSLERPPRAGDMDRMLHDERLENRRQCSHRLPWGGLPDGAVAQIDGAFIAKKSGAALAWSFEGYHHTSAPNSSSPIDCWTPPATLAVLKAGYQPRWHPTASQ